MRGPSEVPFGETSSVLASMYSPPAAPSFTDASSTTSCSAADTPSSCISCSPSSAADASTSVGILSSFPFAAPSSPHERETAFRARGPLVEEAAYTIDTKGLRYMSFCALAKFVVSNLLSHFFLDSTSSATDAEETGVGTEYLLNSASVQREICSGRRRFNTDSSFLAQGYYGQLAARAHRRENEAAVARPPALEARGSTPALSCDKFADSAKTTQPAAGGHNVQAESPSLCWGYSPVCLREFLARRGEAAETNKANKTKRQPACDLRQEVFAGILSVEKLAMLDAGVYVRPDLSEILASRQEANQVQSILQRCKSIDTKIYGLKNKAKLLKLPSDVVGEATQRKPREEGGEAVSNRGGEGETLAGDTRNKVRTDKGLGAAGTECEKSVVDTSIACPNVPPNTRMRETERSPGDAYYAVAACAEIVVLQQEKQHLRRHLADVRALLEYVWKYWGLSLTSRMNLGQFSQAFCSNHEDSSQQHAAAILFDLCDTDHRGHVTFEELFSRLPLLAMEVMFIVTEMERKARQAYRYYWI